MGITMKIKLKQVFLFLYLFYFMYAPSIGNGTSLLFTNYMLSIILLAFVLLIECRKVAGKVLCQLQNRRIALFFIGIVMASVYYMSRVLTSRVYYQGIEDLRIVQNGIVFVYLIHALVIVSIFKNWKYSFEDAWKFIFRVASLQGVICVLMFLVPSFKNIANIIFANYSGFRVGDYIMLTRIYGLSCDYTYGMPLIHGVLSAVCFYFALERGKNYFFYFPFLFLVAVLNSRTGLFLGVFGVFLSFVFYFSKHRLSKRTAKLIITIVLAAGAILLVLCSNPFTYQFLSALFQEIYEFVFRGNKVGTTEYLLESHLFFPEGMEFVFGRGHRVYGEAAKQAGYMASDIGFVNDMFMGGLIYCGILYGTIFFFILRKTKNLTIRFIQFLLAASWMIANIKGQVTVNYSFSVLMVLMVAMVTFLEDDFYARKQVGIGNYECIQRNRGSVKAKYRINFKPDMEKY